MNSGNSNSGDNKENILYVVYNYRYHRSWSNLKSESDSSLSFSESKGVSFRDQGLSYFVLYAFVEQMPIDEATLKSVYQKLFSVAPDAPHIGPFEGGDGLHQFVKALLVRLQLPVCYLISVQEYNMGLEVVNSTKDFLGIFESYGKKFTNSEFSTRPRFFDRIFGDA